MARLACETKMGYYPTSTKTIQKVIDKTISFPEDKVVYALDCCAGEGEAIDFIGSTYNCKTFAVELDDNRAKVAVAKHINKVLNADALSGVRKSNHWVGLNFLNPPYDVSASGTRLELDFIERWGLTTSIGGALILVINPSSADDKMTEKLRLQGYRPVVSFYDPENEDYKNYGQFFMVLHQQLPNFRASLEKFYSLFENPLNINDDIDFEKISIKTGAEPQLFKEIELPRWKVEEHLAKSKLKKVFFDELRQASMINSSIEHPNEGQAAILIASGALNKKLTLADGTEVILKGTSTKEKTQSAQTNDDGIVDKVKLVDHYKTVVYGLSLTHGQFVKYA
ncbi:DUF6094 domain-containing protein [Sulfurimonas sp.]|uniref:DUF6094 domain-containing protein n=1 Tax=Sulfurimonas sp. TaxID=2022749 RepID=UPI0025E9F3BC|nr:DUF6094 domain-containing protein [Sulfurimonas sp.]MBW6487500.1 hypothetical protein [Sulfurimonas sp.]